MKSAILTAFTLAALACLLTGCTPWATYPPIEGQRELATPALEPIPTLVEKSIAYHRSRNDMEDIAFALNMPPNTSAQAYRMITKRFDHAHAMQSADDNPTYHVLAIRVRGLDAEVDMIVPTPDGVYERQTYRLNQPPFQGWRVEGVRPWRVRIELPPPNYVPDGKEEATVSADGAGEPDTP